MAVESLAVLPVVSSLVFIFRSLGLSYQEVNIALIGKEKQNYRILRNFAICLGLIVTVLISVLAFTPLADLWFINVSGLSTELAGLSYLPLKIMILLPALIGTSEFPEILPYNKRYHGSDLGGNSNRAYWHNYRIARVCGIPESDRRGCCLHRICSR